MKIGIRSMVFMLVLLLAAGLPACGGDGNGDGQGDPGKISVSASGITGFFGTGTSYVLILTVNPEGSSHNALGVLCEAIDADPFSISAKVVQTPPADGNPCGTLQGDKTFDPDTYDVGFYVIEAGTQTPDRQTMQKATVDGDVTVTAPSFDQWTTP